MIKKGLLQSRIKHLHNNFDVKDLTNRRFYIEYIKFFHCEDEFEKKVVEDIMSRCPMQGDITRVRNYLAKEKFIEKKKNYKMEKEIRDEYSPINNVISSLKRWFKF